MEYCFNKWPKYYFGLSFLKFVYAHWSPLERTHYGGGFCHTYVLWVSWFCRFRTLVGFVFGRFCVRHRFRCVKGFVVTYVSWFQWFHTFYGFRGFMSFVVSWVLWFHWFHGFLAFVGVICFCSFEQTSFYAENEHMHLSDASREDKVLCCATKEKERKKERKYSLQF